MLEYQMTTHQKDVIEDGFKAGRSMLAIERRLKTIPGTQFTHNAIRAYLHRRGLWPKGANKPKWVKDIHGIWHQVSRDTK